MAIDASDDRRWSLLTALVLVATARGAVGQIPLTYTASTVVSGQTAGTVGINTAANVDPAWTMWIYRLGVNGARFVPGLQRLHLCAGICDRSRLVLKFIVYHSRNSNAHACARDSMSDACAA